MKELHAYLNKNRCILPAYTTMQSLISRAIINHERRIDAVISKNLEENTEAAIRDLLSKESEHRYYLTLMKPPPNSFTYIQAIKERKKRDFLLPIYLEATRILSETGISQQSIKYYARLVDNFTIHRLQQLTASKRYFYILCFVCYRHQRINDALVKTFLHHVTKFQNDTKARVREKILELNIATYQNLKKGAEILDLLTSDLFDDNDRVGNLRAEAYQILPKHKIKTLSSFLERSNVNFEELRWKEYDLQTNKVRKNIRHIFKSIVFEPSSDIKNIPLYNAITYLQKYILTNQRVMINAPIAHIPNRTLKYLYTDDPKDKIIDPFRYEWFAYRMLKKKIDSTDIWG